MEKSLAKEYSSYTLKIFCDITQIKLNDDMLGILGFGCCLRDLTQQGGGYCLRLKSEKTLKTAYLTELDFKSIVLSPFDMTNISDVADADTYEGITTFKISTSEAETDSENFKFWTGTKV